MEKNNSVDALKKIKDKYGEEMMLLCCELFEDILEKPNLLFRVLEKNFVYSDLLYDDIVNNNLKLEFKNYIYSLVNGEKRKIVTSKTPEELLKEAGYILYECHNEEEIQVFKKYYAKNEELCTFYGDRLKRCHVFFAVRENVDDIKRDDFVNPKREDEYGTSVISIQFSRGDKNTLSIKNRYNHHVNNSDATFSNNLENIIPGLTYAFEKEYNLNINQDNTNKFDLTDYKYVKANDGKYYKYNYEINNIYYCPNNIIIDDFEVIRKYEEKDKYIVIDYFIIDLRKKKIKFYDYNIQDSFIDGLHDISNIKVVKQKESGNKVITIMPTKGSNITIEIDKQNRIISYQNGNLEQVGNNFLRGNQKMQELNLPRLERVGDGFLFNNQGLKKLSLQNLKQVGNYFLCYNEEVQELILLSLEQVGDGFLYFNRLMKKLTLPNLEKVGDNFFANNELMQEINLSSLVKVGNDFLYHNKKIQELDLSSLEQVGDGFLYFNQEIRELNLSSLKWIENCFLHDNEVIQKLNLPRLFQVGDYFLYCNKELNELNLPRLNRVGDYFLYSNVWLRKLNLPMLNRVGDYFLRSNVWLRELNLQNLEYVFNYFLYNNVWLRELNLPSLRLVGDYFLCRNKLLKELNLPNLQLIGNNFLKNNNQLQEINLPRLKKSGSLYLKKSKIKEYKK